MDTRDMEAMSQKVKDLTRSDIARISDYLINVYERGEQAELRALEKRIAELRCKKAQQEQENG